MTTPRRQLIFILALVVAIGVTFFFGYRVGVHSRHFRRQTDPIRAWMSVPFIAHSHHMPAEPLFEAAGVPPQRHDRRSLRNIARDQKRPVEDVIRAVEKAVAARKPDAERRTPPANVP